MQPKSKMQHRAGDTARNLRNQRARSKTKRQPSRKKPPNRTRIHRSQQRSTASTGLRRPRRRITKKQSSRKSTVDTNTNDFIDKIFSPTPRMSSGGRVVSQDDSAARLQALRAKIFGDETPNVQRVGSPREELPQPMVLSPSRPSGPFVAGPTSNVVVQSPYSNQ